MERSESRVLHPSESTLVLLFLQVTVLVAVFLHIVVAQQVLGFFYLSFIPGFSILRLIKNNLSRTSIVVFSVGISAAFLMGLGLFVSQLLQ